MLAGQMDQFGLLWGPTFDGYEKQMAEKLHELGAFPIQASGTLVQLAHQAQGGEPKPPEDVEAQKTWGKELAVGMLENWLQAAEDPEFDSPVIGLVVPHLDYVRGGEVYASGYRAWVGAAKPDRVVILGTNHFGMGDGAVMSRLDFETPLGRIHADQDVINGMAEKLGDRIFKDELDLLPEHSAELHLPFIQHLFGDVPVVVGLVPDPLVPMIADDGKRVSSEELTSALQRGARERPAASRTSSPRRTSPTSARSSANQSPWMTRDEWRSSATIGSTSPSSWRTTARGSSKPWNGARTRPEMVLDREHVRRSGRSGGGRFGRADRLPAGLGRARGAQMVSVASIAFLGS